MRKKLRHTLTILAPSSSLPPVGEACNFLTAHDVAFEAPIWLQEQAVCALTLPQPMPETLLQQFYAKIRDDWGYDVMYRPATQPPKRLFMADMDATMLEEETLDALAEDLGLAERIVPITKAAMAGEIDFETALNQRVSLLKGVPETALQSVWEEASICAGAGALLRRLKGAGVRCVLVSGGFTFFTERLAAALGFDAHFGNMLEVENGHLTGRVCAPILGKEAKLRHLLAECEALGVSPDQAVAIGDGANDLAMLQAAGLGVAYRGKDALRQALPHSQLNHAELDVLAAVILP